MTEKRYTIFGEWHKDCVIDEIRDNTGEYVTIGRVVDLLNENEQLKQQISYLIRELKTEKETSISKNERIRLDFAITVLESLKR